MKIMYKKYSASIYEEISIKELMYRTSQEYYDKIKQELRIGIFIIELIEATENELYFAEGDAYDW